MPNYFTFIVADDGAIVESNCTQLPLAAHVAYRINLTRHDIPGRPIAVLECDGREIASAPIGGSDRAHAACSVDCSQIILHMMLCGGWHKRDLIDAMKTHAGINVPRSRIEQWMQRGSKSTTMYEVALVAQVLCAEALRRDSTSAAQSTDTPQ